MSKYETLGGYVTKAEAHAKFLHHIKEAEDQAYVIGHLLRTESTRKDEVLATGWRAIGQMMNMIHDKAIKLGQGKLQ
jgi:hypothetical protein